MTTTTARIFSGNISIPKELKVLKDNDPASYHMFRILTPDKGDERVVWNPMNIAEISAASELFQSLLKKGMRAFAPGRLGQKDKEVEEFDPLMGEVIFCPVDAIVGG